MKLVIELEPGLWWCDGRWRDGIGNLTRTLVKEQATVLSTNKEANLALLGARLDRPFPRAIIQATETKAGESKEKPPRRKEVYRDLYVF